MFDILVDASNINAFDALAVPGVTFVKYGFAASLLVPEENILAVISTLFTRKLLHDNAFIPTILEELSNITAFDGFAVPGVVSTAFNWTADGVIVVPFKLNEFTEANVVSPVVPNDTA
jgi:hypothetical protein